MMKVVWKLSTLGLGICAIILANAFEAEWYFYLPGIVISLLAILSMGAAKTESDPSGLGKRGDGSGSLGGH